MFLNWLSQAAWVGVVELVQGLAPAGGLLALDEAGGLVGALAGGLAAGRALAGALVLDVDDGQPQQLDDGVVAREVAAGLGDLAELVVQRLDRVGRIEQLADRRAERQERDEGVPGLFQTRAACGYFWPHGEAANAASASKAASAVGAV